MLHITVLISFSYILGLHHLVLLLISHLQNEGNKMFWVCTYPYTFVSNSEYSF
jgi:hypothetical protein